MLQLKYTKTLQLQRLVVQSIRNSDTFKSSIPRISLKLQRLVVQSIRNSDTFKSSIPQISLKLQRLAVQSIRNSDTFEILCTSNIIKTAETGSAKYQKF